MKKETKMALELVAEGYTPYMAAKMAGVSLSTVTRAMERELSRCPECGAVRKVVKK